MGAGVHFDLGEVEKMFRKTMAAAHEQALASCSTPAERKLVDLQDWHTDMALQAHLVRARAKNESVNPLFYSQAFGAVMGMILGNFMDETADYPQMRMAFASSFNAMMAAYLGGKVDGVSEGVHRDFFGTPGGHA